MVRHVYVQLALFRQSSEGQIATPQKAVNRAHRIMPKKQVQLRVKRMAEMKFNNYFLAANLSGKSAEARLINVGRGTKGELSPELLRQRFLQTYSCLVVELGILLDDPVCAGDLLLGKSLHPDQEAATFAVATRPFFNLLVKLPPPAQVEVSNAEVRSVRDRQRSSQAQAIAAGRYCRKFAALVAVLRCFACFTYRICFCQEKMSAVSV